MRTRSFGARGRRDVRRDHQAFEVGPRGPSRGGRTDTGPAEPGRGGDLQHYVAHDGWSIRGSHTAGRARAAPKAPEQPVQPASPPQQPRPACCDGRSAAVIDGAICNATARLPEATPAGWSPTCRTRHRRRPTSGGASIGPAPSSWSGGRRALQWGLAE